MFMLRLAAAAFLVVALGFTVAAEAGLVMLMLSASHSANAAEWQVRPRVV